MNSRKDSKVVAEILMTTSERNRHRQIDVLQVVPFDVAVSVEHVKPLAHVRAGEPFGFSYRACLGVVRHRRRVAFGIPDHPKLFVEGHGYAPTVAGSGFTGAFTNAFFATS